jgi:2-dehydro-3-deoxyphosphogalactonate aldolase
VIQKQIADRERRASVTAEHALKFFPADVLGSAGTKVVAAILRRKVPLLAVGGVDAGNIATWLKAGIAGFGIGSSL